VSSGERVGKGVKVGIVVSVEDGKTDGVGIILVDVGTRVYVSIGDGGD
jgi:hypothetical protein